MPGLTISIAGISIAIHMEKPLESLINPLKKLFRGFLCNDSKAHAVLNLSFDIFNTCPEIKAFPTALTLEGFPEYTKIIHEIGDIYALSKDSILVGYLNGCLAFNRSSNEGCLLFFRTKRSNLTIGSLYKLLFVFISLVLADRSKYMLHGAGIKGNTGGYLFLGPSGAGKSTVARFCRKQEVLSDDSPVIEKKNGLFYIHSSPFSQVSLFDTKARNHYLEKVQLSKLFFLKKSDELILKGRARSFALAEILIQHIHSFEFMGKECRKEAFCFFNDLCDNIPAYDLHFQKNRKFWDIISK